MPSLTAPELSRSSSPSASRAEAAGPGFAVYVHWPFCASKCPYCDFNSHVRAGGIDEARFLKAYTQELDHMGRRTGPREVTSVFFGGGTPSLMDPATTAAMLERIASNWSLPESAEITLEANPTSVEADRFAGYRAAGVTRVSLGIQALDDAALRALGRLHDVQEALAALEIAQDTFDRVSFDLIYARPGQTVGAWEPELKQALALGASHLSLYQLTIEAGTPFARLHAAGKLAVPEGDHAAALYETTQELCEAAGLPAYEISNHAAPGAECRHNLVYWRGGTWAGVGPGAHGRLDTEDGRLATATLKSPESWLAQVEAQGHGLETQETVTGREQAEEYLLMGLRLAEGIDIARYEALGGALDEAAVTALEGDCLIERDDGRLAATPAGRLVLNAVIGALV
jgi:putative oxygen-independent coproporphyrinogen III oxidase